MKTIKMSMNTIYAVYEKWSFNIVTILIPPLAYFIYYLIHSSPGLDSEVNKYIQHTRFAYTFVFPLKSEAKIVLFC